MRDTPRRAPRHLSSDRRINPSNTGNISAASRFTLADGLAVSLDPSFQTVKANGGGTVTLPKMAPTRPDRFWAPTGRYDYRAVAEHRHRNCVAGYFGGTRSAGRDVNGDGDILDQVRVIAPSQTRDARYGLISGLRWEINDDHTMRVTYTFDHANHRQTGEVGLLRPTASRSMSSRSMTRWQHVNGVILQKRDRQSYAILHQCRESIAAIL